MPEIQTHRLWAPVVLCRALSSIFVTTFGDSPGELPRGDSNSDGEVDISAAVFTFAYLFNGGPPPPDPGPLDCGPDLTEDTLDCSFYNRYDGPVGCDSSECCREGFVCIREDGDGNGVGECREQPAGGPEIFDPVCGCDNRTYANRCEAYAAGVSGVHEGVCGGNPCSSHAECDTDLYCARETGDCDGTGQCCQRPEACPRHFDPVCGGDGNTYAATAVTRRRQA